MIWQSAKKQGLYIGRCSMALKHFVQTLLPDVEKAKIECAKKHGYKLIFKPHPEIIHTRLIINGIPAVTLSAPTKIEMEKPRA